MWAAAGERERVFEAHALQQLHCFEVVPRVICCFDLEKRKRALGPTVFVYVVLGVFSMNGIITARGRARQEKFLLGRSKHSSSHSHNILFLFAGWMEPYTLHSVPLFSSSMADGQ